ncbi:threonine aspartase 1 isoform X4 [Notamacropus eugenii]|uniref:threonine aspartase 1 isoform X4 n=1 Tax=Notamacropus eugenii TaxID=9315 RepID=UPI003B684F87
MIMEKGMSSTEGLPSKSPQVMAVKVTAKEHETKLPHKEKRVGFVLVHAGAGYHSESKAKEYKHVCKRACQKAIEQLQAGALATDAVTAALVELEDSPFTNAGMGSNLNLLGEIECDASIMDGKSLNFGAVGALSGIKNPVSVANRLLCEGQKGKLSAGRIPPCFLVGEGAYRWAVDHGIPSCSPSVMTTSCGEHLVRTILARECSHALQAEDAHQALLETMQNKFISSPFLASEEGVLGGVIVLRSCRCSAEPDSSQDKQTLLVEFLWSHTTESMCVGYMSAQDGKAKPKDHSSWQRKQKKKNSYFKTSSWCCSRTVSGNRRRSLPPGELGELNPSGSA